MSDYWKNIVLKIINPVTLATIILLIATISLLGHSWDSLLVNLEESSYARGLITYLFSVVIIGVVIVIILYVFTADHTDASEKTISHAKDILGLLLGIFGTIIGYYFGSEKGAANKHVEPYKIEKVRALPDTIKKADSYPLSYFIEGENPTGHLVFTSDGLDFHSLNITGKFVKDNLKLQESTFKHYQGKHLYVYITNQDSSRRLIDFCFVK